METLLRHYPISMDAIMAKVAKKKVAKRMSAVSFPLQYRKNVKEITNKFGETLVRIDGEIPTDLPIEDGQRFLFISYDQSKYSHGIHKYPAKFFPELPRWLINRYSCPGDLILDPFTGSATTNVEAVLLKRHSVGIDVDIFAKLLAKVKTTPLNNSQLDRAIDVILKKLVLYNDKLIDEEQIPQFPYRDNWFNRDILLELTYIKRVIDELEAEADQSIIDFCRICFSAIIRSVSNADDNCTRTVVRKKLNKQIYPSLALTRFAEHLLTYSLNIKEFSKVCPRGISVEFSKDSDARCIVYPDNSFDLAITSPPYVNAVDYPRTHQLEMYWLGLAEGSLSLLKKSHIGTEVVKAEYYKILHQIGECEADNTVKAIFDKEPRRAYISYKYLYDMKLNMREVYRVLKPNGRYVIVVGNNRIRGELFENWKYLMSIAKQIGYKVENYFGSEIIKHFIKVPRDERIDTDWVIVLQK